MAPLWPLAASADAQISTNPAKQARTAKARRFPLDNCDALKVSSQPDSLTILNPKNQEELHEATAQHGIRAGRVQFEIKRRKALDELVMNAILSDMDFVRCCNAERDYAARCTERKGALLSLEV
jgi:hypothetical protein